ncbi:MAG: ATP-binding protein, partial [Mycobacteriales bacterium]
MPDPFGTAGIRDRVLAAWAASPERFREDANAEEDLALGGYRDRLLIELAQNAADAAAAAGVAGELRLRLADGCLLAANTGAPLDAPGVAALSSLRASAKRDGGSVGRFGVGFAAVLAVTDEPEIRSLGGGVRFSAAETRGEVAGLPSLAAELERRGGAVPVLRLPRPLDGQPPEGFSTEVRLPLRPAAIRVVQAALDALDAALLLALPALSTVDVNGRIITRSGSEPHIVTTDGGVETRWHVVSAGGTIPGELLADRPIEERERASWDLLWALPATALPGRQVVQAPTPSDEPLSLPARLVASFPLGPDRRHVAPGPLTDWLVERCADSYLDLVRSVDGGPDVLRLVPLPGLAAGQLDAALS